MELRDWLDAYARAWEERDPAAAVALFTEDAVYRSHPFRQPSARRDGVEAYWEQATAGQRNIHVRFGEPIVAGEHVAAEWWTTMVEMGEDVTIAGCLILRFAPDGRCQELREYWHLEPSRRTPHDGWGR